MLMLAVTIIETQIKLNVVYLMYNEQSLQLQTSETQHYMEIVFFIKTLPKVCFNGHHFVTNKLA